MGLLPLPAHFCAVESIYSEVSVISNLSLHPKTLRLETVHMNYDMKKSGERIRQLRIQRGFTQENVAQVLNIDRSFYSRIEAGKNGCAVDLFIQLSGLFEVSLDYLILGKYDSTLLRDTERDLLKEGVEKAIACLEQIRTAL